MASERLVRENCQEKRCKRLIRSIDDAHIKVGKDAGEEVYVMKCIEIAVDLWLSAQ